MRSDVLAKARYVSYRISAKNVALPASIVFAQEKAEVFDEHMWHNEHRSVSMNTLGKTGRWFPFQHDPYHGGGSRGLKGSGSRFLLSSEIAVFRYCYSNHCQRRGSGSATSAVETVGFVTPTCFEQT